MKPAIDHTEFGSIVINGECYDHDVVIRLDAKIDKRKKKLSQMVYGTSHLISLEEAKFVFEEGMDTLLIGAGQSDQVRLSEEARAYLARNGVKVVTAATPEAVRLWNEAGGRVVGLFHVTC